MFEHNSDVTSVDGLWRDLTILGRIILSKSEEIFALFILLYHFMLIPSPAKQLILNFQLMWKNKVENISKKS